MNCKFIVLSLLFSATGFSQTISTEAPSVSASAVTIPKGFLQAEVSAGFGINNDAPSSAIRSNELPFLLTRYGISDRWEFRTQHRTQFTRFNGINNYQYTSFGVGVKYSILPNEGRTNLAVIANYTPFNGIWRAQQGDVTLAFSQELFEKHALGGNIGYGLFGIFAEGFGVFSVLNSLPASAYYSWNFIDKWTGFGEFYYQYSQLKLNDIEEFSGNGYGIDFGLQFLLREHIQLDWVSGFNLTNKEQFHSLGFNIYFKTKE